MRHEIPTHIFLKEVIYHIRQEILEYDIIERKKLEANRIDLINNLFSDFVKSTIIFDSQTHEDDERIIAEELNKMRIYKLSDSENEDVVAILRAMQIVRIDLHNNPDYVQDSGFVKLIRDITKLNIKELGNRKIRINIEVKKRVWHNDEAIFYDDDLEEALNYKYSLQEYETIQNIFIVDKPKFIECKNNYSVTLSLKYEGLFNSKEQLERLYTDLINPALTIITYKNIRKEQLKSQPWFSRFLYFIKNEKF